MMNHVVKLINWIVG